MEIVNDKNAVHLAENLRVLRKRMNWSQEEMADKVGLNRGNIASYENGSAEPRICNLLKVAHLFGISVFDLTHTSLRDENAIQRAAQSQQNGKSPMQLPISTIADYEKKAEDIQTALKGLKCLFRMKLNHNGQELPPELKALHDQYEQLHELSQHLLESHQELISHIKKHCPDSAA
mgnify:CR=1 FL=1